MFPEILNDLQKVARLQAGLPVRFDRRPMSGRETSQAVAVRTIQASWLVALIGGPRRRVQVPIALENAIVVGPLDFQGVTFECDIAMSGCQFSNGVNFAYATFETRLSLVKCEFHGPTVFLASRIGVTGQTDGIFAGSHFCQGIELQRAEITGNLHFGGVDAIPAATIDGFANFAATRIGGSADFVGVGISDQALFERLVVGGNLMFSAGENQSAARFTADANFEDITIHGNAVFHQVHFGSSASFKAAQIDGDIGFDGAYFGGEANFERIVVGGTAFFNPSDFPVRFASDAYFLGGRIAGDANFSGAQFEGSAQFSRFHVSGSANFDSFHAIPLSVGKDLSFSGATIRQTLNLTKGW